MVNEAVSYVYGLSFYGLAFFAVISAIVVISARNPVISALWLVVCFISVAAIYALLKAQFLAMIQILVYAGAVMVLFVMIIMLMDIGKMEPGGRGQNVLRYFAAIAGVVLMITLVILNSGAGRVQWNVENKELITGNTELIGGILFTKYLLPFEALSLLLLAAVVSAIYLARRGEGQR